MSLLRFAVLALLFGIAGGDGLLAAGPGQPEEDAAATIREDEPTSEQRVLAALNQPTKIEAETTLKDALSTLSELHQIPIVLDLKALADAGVDVASPVDVRVSGLKLRSALNVLLRELDLAWLVENEVLFITTRDVADTRLVTKSYPVADLLAVRDQFGQVDELFADELDDEDLIGAILTILEPDTWEANGGAGNVDTLKGALVVDNTAEIHEQVARLLDGLRAARLQQYAADPAARYRPILVDEGPESAAVRKIRAALNDRVKWNYTETPLSEVAGSLSVAHGIAVALDRKALSDAGVDFDAPITMRVEGITLASALNLMLRELDLAFRLEDDRLLITTRDIADTCMGTRLYPVRDFVVDLDSGESDFERLLENVQDNVCPDTWEANGGAGGLEVFQNSLCLIVRNTDEVHAEVEKLLTGLRGIPSHKEPPLTREGLGKADDVIRIRTHELDLGYAFSILNDIPRSSQRSSEQQLKIQEASDKRLKQRTQEIVELVKEAVGADAWKSEGVFIKSLSDRIVVKHNGRIQRLVRRALIDMGFITPGGAARSFPAAGCFRSFPSSAMPLHPCAIGDESAPAALTASACIRVYPRPCPRFAVHRSAASNQFKRRGSGGSFKPGLASRSARQLGATPATGSFPPARPAS